MFGQECDNLKEKQCYTLTEVRISKYQSQRLLKTTPFTVIKLTGDDSAIKMTDSDFVETTKVERHAKIVSVDLKSLAVKYVCTNCKAELQEVEDGIATCKRCENMMVVDECRKLPPIVFSIITASKKKLALTATVDKIQKCFDVNQEDKRNLAKLMLNSLITIKYSASDNAVLEMTELDDGLVAEEQG